jgi:hypothetical protein
MSESRERKRFTVWFPMKVGGPEGPESVAVSRNVSTKGLLMAAASQLEAGKSITVTFRLAGHDGSERTVQGKIIRTEPNSDDPDGLWPYRVAVQFEEPQEELEPLLEELADRQPFK